MTAWLIAWVGCVVPGVERPESCVGIEYGNAAVEWTTFTHDQDVYMATVPDHWIDTDFRAACCSLRDPERFASAHVILTENLAGPRESVDELGFTYLGLYVVGRPGSNPRDYTRSDRACLEREWWSPAPRPWLCAGPPTYRDQLAYYPALTRSCAASQP